MFIADNNLAGESRGNYGRSAREKHIASHGGDNGWAQLVGIYQWYKRGGKRITRNRWKQIDYPQWTSACISITVNFNINDELFLLGPGTAIREEAEWNVGKVLVSLRGTHDLTVRCQNAKGLIDSLVLNCMFELISTLGPRYMEGPPVIVY